MTAEGRFGTRVSFGPGLNVLRADNSSGKSTLLQSILWGLGLEGMLGPGKRVPLTPSVVEELRTPEGNELGVLESQVFLEFSNAEGQVMTTQRWIKHESVRRELITVWFGGKLSDPDGDLRRGEFYVGFEGSARREMGFHARLAEFIGWELPQVQRYDGSESPLYMEVIFPLLYVEQKHGWAGVLANMPDYLQIRDPGARAVEFILDLDAIARAKRREELKELENSIKREWAANVAGLAERLSNVGAVLEGVPSQPALNWPPEIEPIIRVARASGWSPLPVAIREGRAELERLDREEIPRAEEAADSLTAELRQLERQYAEVSAATSGLLREARIEAEQVEALNTRLSTLVEDKQRNVDARRLRDLGALGSLGGEAPHCPTCHQALQDSLLDIPESVSVMPIEENILLIEEEMGIFRAMREDSERVLGAKRQRVVALRDQTDELRRAIRSAKRTLVADGTAPSEAAVAHRVRLQDRIELLERLADEYSIFSETLTELANRFRVVRGELRELNAASESSSDARKLGALEGLVEDQLRSYGFQSIDPDSVQISHTKYVPVREGFNLGHDISASDMVRLIWAYLLGLLEVAREEATNHPGLLILDEPRQQDAAEVSFRELIRRAANAESAGQQVIFATSEDVESLNRMLDGVPHRLRPFDGLVVEPL
jgi:hypothetical protein